MRWLRLRARRPAAPSWLQADARAHARGAAVCGPRTPSTTFGTLLPSVDQGLLFNAEIAGWWYLTVPDRPSQIACRGERTDAGRGAPAPQGAVPAMEVPVNGPIDVPRYPGVVARSLLRSAAREATAHHSVLDPDAAQDAVNLRFARDIRCGALVVAGSARVWADPGVAEQARFRAEQCVRLRTAEAAETARVEALRERLLTSGTGLLWWLERKGVLEPAGKATEKPGELTQAFERLVDELRKSSHTPTAPTAGDYAAELHAQLDDLIAMMADPRHLEQAVRNMGQVARYVGSDGKANRRPAGGAHTRPDTPNAH